MSTTEYLHRVVDLMRADRNFLLNSTHEQAVALVSSGDPTQVAQIQGQFAIAAVSGRTVRMARSIGRTIRYFLAKQADGPCLYIAETMAELQSALKASGLADQFHPTYTRTVPAHYVVQIELVGCPDPNPRYERYFTPTRNSLPSDIEAIGRRYIGQLADSLDQWLDIIPKREPIGVLFSGGIDSGALLLTLNHRLLQRGESPARLKAFTLSVGNHSQDTAQAHAFVKKTQLEMLWEPIACTESDLDWRQAVRVVEDYKPLDIQSATMAMALCHGIRNRYPEWTYLVDGDGGDENLKDYPIEDNPELTIRSVLNNLMLYQEGWGVNAIKHSLVHTGGQSRGHVRTSAPAAKFGFRGFSPFALPQVIQVAESIPFIELTQWDHEKLYALKGQVVCAGVKSVTGFDMPVFAKRRFQHGALDRSRFESVFPTDEAEYRKVFLDQWKFA
ncbi:MAG: asparagine synthase-related protein [Pirellula sp.]